MTAAVPDMPCPQQLRGCSAYTLKSAHYSSFKGGSLDPRQLRKVHNIHYPVLSGTRFHKIYQDLRLSNLSFMEFLLFQIKSYYSMSSFSKGRETKSWLAKRFNNQVYLSNVTDWILTIINFLLLCRDLLLPWHIFLLYLLVEQHWFLLFGRRHNRISLTILIICNRQFRQYMLFCIFSALLFNHQICNNQIVHTQEKQTHIF